MHVSRVNTNVCTTTTRQPSSITGIGTTSADAITARRWQDANPAYAGHMFGGWRCENGVRA